MYKILLIIGLPIILLSKTITFEEALELTLKNNKELKAKEIATKKSIEDLKEAKGYKKGKLELIIFQRYHRYKKPLFNYFLIISSIIGNNVFFFNSNVRVPILPFSMCSWTISAYWWGLGSSDKSAIKE